MTWLNLLGFFKSNWRVLALICAAAALYLAGSHHGLKAEQAREASRLKAAQAKVAKREAQADKITAKTSADLQKTRVEIQYRTVTLTKEIPTYVPIDPSRGSLPVGFVRLYDAAVLGVSPAPDGAGRADAEPSGVTDAQLAQTDIENLGACRANAAQLEAFQRWYEAIRASYNAR
jgi:hypothetical protein